MNSGIRILWTLIPTKFYSYEINDKVLASAKRITSGIILIADCHNMSINVLIESHYKNGREWS